MARAFQVRLPVVTNRVQQRESQRNVAFPVSRRHLVLENRDRQAGIVHVQRNEGIERLQRNCDGKMRIFKLDPGKRVRTGKFCISKPGQSLGRVAAESTAASKRRLQRSFNDLDERISAFWTRPQRDETEGENLA